MLDLGILGDPAFLVVQCLNGLTQAMFLFLIASGLTLIFGVLGVLNFAHGSLYMLGAYLSYTIASLFVGRPSAFWVALVLWLLLTRTQFGRLIRAAASDREMVGVVGADVSRLFTGVFVLGAWLGGLGGGLAAPVGAIYPGMDVEVIAESFIVVVVGGMGSLTGTLLGSLIIGQLNAFGILFFPRFALLFVYVLMVVVLVVRPWGLLGKPHTR